MFLACFCRDARSAAFIGSVSSPNASRRARLRSKSSPSLLSNDPLTRSQISALLKQSGKSLRATLPPREVIAHACVARDCHVHSPISGIRHRGFTSTIWLASECLPAECTICRSLAAAKFKPAIRMRRSSRPWSASMVYFGSCWPLRRPVGQAFLNVGLFPFWTLALVFILFSSCKWNALITPFVAPIWCLCYSARHVTIGEKTSLDGGAHAHPHS